MWSFVTDLADRWSDLWDRLGAVGDVDARYVFLSGLYAQPPRAYHTIEHIKTCLAEFDSARHLSSRPEEVEFALWLHDAVYDSRRVDNEKQSAELAGEVAAEMGLDASFSSRVGALILATEHEEMPSEIDAQLIVDCDLAGLGIPFDQFMRNGDFIRQECAWLDEAAFIENRTLLFRRFLERPSVYCTEFFGSRYERQARCNLERVLGD